MSLKPFFCYYGGKWRAAPKYPAPQYDTIIEPFAGAAGYSTRHHQKKVILYDSDPVIAGLWDYLIHVSAEDIRRLPLEVKHVDDLKCCQEAKWLIGFWLNKGSATPHKQPTTWMTSGVRPNSHWGGVIRERIASQVDLIRHWKVFNREWDFAPNMEATWFVDPPYNNKAGTHYTHNSVHYPKLAEWCRCWKGQVIVCENDGADWLPFRPFATIKSNSCKRGKGYSKEVIWTNT